MAITKIRDISHGTSAERIAAAIGKFAPTEKFYEYDTGLTYVTNGVIWSVVPSLVTVAARPIPLASNINSAATVNANLLKTGVVTLLNIVASNASASTRYLKLYNKATAPAVGTDIPVLTIAIAPSSTVSIQFGSLGHKFILGLGIGITGLPADTDTTIIGASDVKVMASYI